MHFLQKTQTIQQSPSACEVRRVLFLIHRSRDAPADERFCFFFLHFLCFLCIYFMVFMQKSHRSLPRPSVMLLSQISFGCSPGIADVIAVAKAAAQLRAAVFCAGVVIGTLHHIHTPDAVTGLQFFWGKARRRAKNAPGGLTKTPGTRR